MINQILSYQGNDLDLLTKLRLQWPLQWKINMVDAMQAQSFWTGIPDSVWGIRLWQTITNPYPSEFLFLPSRFHQILAEQFAVSSNSIWTSLLSLEDLSESTWAIVLLVKYLKIFHLLEEPIPSSRFQKIFSKLNENTKAIFGGLDSEVQMLMAELLDSFHIFLGTIYSNKGDAKSSLIDHLSILHKYIPQPGLVGWLASKWAIHIINSSITLDIFNAESDKTVQLIYNDLTALYTDNSYLLGQGKAFHSYERRYSLYLNPQNILLKTGERVKVIEILANNIYAEKEFPFNWIDRISVTSSMLRCLIDDSKTANSLENLLRYFGGKPLFQLVNDQHLHTSHIQRIIKTVRTTNDPQVLKGALAALTWSNFLSLAGSEQSSRMLKMDTGAALFARLTFRRGNEEPKIKGKEIINDIAKEVMASPSNYSFRVNTIIAEYLAETTQISLPPLLSLEDELKIRISSNKSR